MSLREALNPLPSPHRREFEAHPCLATRRTYIGSPMSGVALRHHVAGGVERRPSPPLASNGRADRWVRGVSDPHLARCSSPRARPTGVAHAPRHCLYREPLYAGDVATRMAGRVPRVVQAWIRMQTAAVRTSEPICARHSTAITRSILELCSAPSRLVAALRPRVPNGAAFGP